MSGLDYPKLHSRETKVEKASYEIALECLKMQDKFELTDMEFLKIINGMVATKLKYMLRVERHGDINKPSGLED